MEKGGGHMNTLQTFPLCEDNDYIAKSQFTMEPKKISSFMVETENMKSSLYIL